GFFEALTRLPGALTEQDQVGQFQLFIPDLFQQGLTDTQKTNRLNAAYLEGFFTRKLLGLELAKGKISADRNHFTLSGQIDGLGLGASFALDHRPGSSLPRLMAEVALNSNQLKALLGKLGLSTDLVSDVVSVNSKLRLFSPGFDISSGAERIKKTGGIEFT